MKQTKKNQTELEKKANSSPGGVNEDKEFLRTEPLGKLLLRLALPTVAAQLINMLYNIVDRIYIGHIPNIGATALTGVGVCMPLIMIVSAFAALVGYGGAPRASIFMGKRDKESAEKTLGNCFMLQILISVVLTVILLIWNRDFLMAFGASENTIEYGVNYMDIYALGTIFVEITLGMNAFITAQGFAKTGMLSVLIGAVSNIILDPIFIFGFNMDVRGAALATIISQAFSCIWVVSFLCGKKTFLRIRRKNLRLVPKIIMPCLALGVATFIMQASESVISVCFNSSLQKYGGDIAVGAMTILTSVMQFAMLPLQGLGQGAQPIISYSYGAGDSGRVRAAFKLLLKVSLGYSILLWILVMLLPGGFAAMFTSDPQLMEYTRTALRIYMGAMFLFGIQMACQMTFNALGKAKESIVVAVMRKFVLLIPLIYIMPQIMKSNQAMAVYMAEPMADFLAVTFTAVLFAVQFKKILKGIGKTQGRRLQTEK
ncbi:MATE family efflux transporter [Blautia sp. An46]|uniref:MATE family efflux transporter n=1 Tax=Blautia sp. An46 TaxID=1965636 RepID=UPI000B3760F6|nr:MATE family efflux transporter [Blautia sp. An46]OUN92927.1 MATE family efflux transporter [Blautia sp. An46]